MENPSKEVNNIRFWYGIPQEDGVKFDEFAKKCFPEGYSQCTEFLRHKTYLINPLLVKKNGIRVNKYTLF